MEEARREKRGRTSSEVYFPTAKKNSPGAMCDTSGCKLHTHENEEHALKS
jgi:hypothetical protein